VYLRTVLTTKDARWRETFGFADFLGVPSRNTTQATQFTKMTAATWLTENSAVAGVLRNARAALLKRDALARLADPAARAAGGEARKLIRDAGPRIDALAEALDTPAVSSLGDGERRRRDDLVAALRTEHANLLRQAEAGYRPPRNMTPPPEARGPGSSSSSMTASMPGGMQQSAWTPATTGGRVFGKKAAPQETAETRPLDERGLVQLQHTAMAQQDEQLTALSGLLHKQRRMGEEISEEIAVQNELLEHLDQDVTRVGSKLARTKRDMNRLG
jgi:regulator of vacuolar morphogenesis